MSVLYLAFVRLPTEKAHGAQIMKTCEALALEGETVELVIPNRTTPIHVDPFSYYGVQPIFALTTLKVPNWVEYGPLGYALSVLWFAERVRWLKTFWSSQCIYSRDAWLLLQYRFLGRKIIYEAHTKPTFISKLVAHSAAYVVVISEGLKDAYRAAGVPESKIILAPDAVDVEAFSVHYDQRAAQSKLGISARSKKIALYVGRIDAPKGVSIFCEACTLEELQCVVVGGGPSKSALQIQYPNVLFLPGTPYVELPQVLAAADVLVAPNSSTDDNAARYTSPLKAFAYLASRKPIIASDVSALTSIFNHEPGVTFFNADSVASLREKLALHSSLTGEFERSVHSWRDRARTLRKYIG